VGRACFVRSTFSPDLVILPCGTYRATAGSHLSVDCHGMLPSTSRVTCSPVGCGTEGRAVNPLEGMVEKKLSSQRSKKP